MFTKYLRNNQNNTVKMNTRIAVNCSYSIDKYRKYKKYNFYFFVYVIEVIMLTKCGMPKFYSNKENNSMYLV